MFNVKKTIFNRRVIFGTTVSIAVFFMLVGVIFWGAFNTVLERTNNMSFCISCHEMKDNVYKEYIETVHYTNRTGVRATCPDCHVPKEWLYKIIRKMSATKELYHKLIGSIDSKEKFARKRQQLANKVWQDMIQTNSRECRNCHNFAAMDIAAQETRSGLIHQYAQLQAKTCIECHKGIAHQLPEGVIPYKGGSDEDHVYYEQQQLKCHQCHPDMPKIEEDWGF